MLFDPADGSKPTQSTVKTGTLATPPQQNPQREGFRFDGWTLDGQPFDFQTPILQDTTLKARWTKITDWTLSPDRGPISGARLTISPPGRQEPCYVSIQAAGDQFIDLTGDGRIYTWTQDRTPEQVPSPAQAPDRFHYLQAATGSRWQAALGSDQHIYTWNSGQATPTILDSKHNAGFTRISMNGDRLLAVDQQGQVYTFQTGLTSRQNLNPKPAEQAKLSLPATTQAVITAASASRILALDAEGQAWTWDTANTGSVKPERVKQAPGTRTVQAQAFSRGFLLLDSKGQLWYLVDSTISPTTAGLPDGVQASRITTNKDQAIITDTDGHVWSWKPGNRPVRAGNGNQPYTQATEAGNRITAIDKQGSIFTWSLNAQGNPSKPARLNTTSTPILESASMDGQPLKISKKDDSWQTEAPAHKPGQATITIIGKQDGQPFNRSLNYTVDQKLTRDTQTDTTYTVSFDTAGGESQAPDLQQVPYPYGRVQRPSPDPTRKDYRFDGWFIDGVAYDFSKPVDKDLTLTAKWTPADRNSTWSISPGKGSQLGRESTTITPPDTSRGIRFNQISGSKDTSYGFSLAVGSDGNAYAWGRNNAGQLGDGTTTARSTPVRVKTPDRKTYPDLPADFTYVQVSGGATHSLALGSDGNAYAWGFNGSGQLGDGTTTSRHTPVRVKTPDRKTYPDLPKDFTYVQVSAGSSYSLALGSDGNAYACGDNSNGQLGDGTTSYSQTTPVKVGKLAGVPTDFAYVQVSAGETHSLALGSDGNAYAWGYNYFGQLGGNGSYSQTTPVRVKTPDRKTYPDLPEDFTYLQVSAGDQYSLALGSDGNAYACGDNSLGSLGDGTTTERHAPVRVKTPDRKTYPDLPKDFTYLQISAGWAHSLALGSDGNTYAWGYNSYGQLGNNTSNSYANPVPARVRDPASPTDKSQGLQATQVSGGGDHSLALGSEGNAYAWGHNRYGQLGNDSIPTGSYYQAQSPVPVPVSFNLTPVITGVRFDSNTATGLTRGDGGSVTVFTPAHQPGTVTVSVDYTLGGAPQTPDTSLRYTYLPAGVLPQAGGEGILLALATGMTGMGGVLASRRHRREQHQLSYASHE
ncbi:InlB B-repeat-containing protein [Bifidobacterium sp. W8113]|uniref:RCC1 domain-containing protein n=1 Tax=Bifidobacterium TaxID=1678 RepID=UPI0018DC5ADA|nr:InlB B-repeat-containing protein [Bifidobacterium choladohabitans]MBI0125620.1 InlB B-repeat-containing protein [Bifidobacterium choladohabitans]MBI0127189.1 InlB B-repeat-containing protein [Bifidobacterium sp. W8103]MBI0137777.1 InlB B-repeat-containing protein [Bifidobacterium sp. W8105]MBI0149252.1 InlB B-repeat-containing protein [Bifidobacterium sp. W8107]